VFVLFDIDSSTVLVDPVRYLYLSYLYLVYLIRLKVKMNDAIRIRLPPGHCSVSFAADAAAVAVAVAVADGIQDPLKSRSQTTTSCLCAPHHLIHESQAYNLPLPHMYQYPPSTTYGYSIIQVCIRSKIILTLRTMSFVSTSITGGR